MSRTRFRPHFEMLEDRWLLTTVTNLADSGSGSLRQAIGLTPSGGTIDFAPSVSGSITLTSAGLEIARNLSIIGPGPAVVTINGDLAFQVLHIDSGFTVTVSGLTIANGRGGATGAGIFNEGNLTLSNCTIAGQRTATGDGAGIYNNHNSLTLIQSTVANNTTAAGNGAGIYNNDGTLTITNSTLSSNAISGSGNGGAIYVNSGIASLTNVTLSGNTASSAGSQGGGIFINNATVNLTNTTIAGNRAGTAGGMRINMGSSNLRNTIVASNTADTAPDLSGTVHSAVSNLIGVNSGLSGITQGVNGNIVGTAANPVNPNLGVLQNNGGPTLTRALLPGSPATDAGTAAGAPATDQRGFNRNVNLAVDIGSYEYQPPLTSITLAPTAASTVGQTVTFRATVTANAPGSNTAAGTVTFLDGARALATLGLDGNGQVALNTSTLTGGSHRISARYNGFAQGDYILSPSNSSSVLQFVQGGIFALGAAPGRVQVRRTSDVSVLADFAPFGSSYSGSISVAVGDVEGNGYGDIVTGTQAGVTQVKVFKAKAFMDGTFNPADPDASLLTHFSPYGPYSVGVNVAVGYVFGSSFADIVTAATSGNPHIKLYFGQAIADGRFHPDQPDAFLFATYFAYGLNFNVGASVTVGDVNGDGYADIITAANTGNPHIKVYNGQAIANGTFQRNPEANVVTQFFAYGLNFNVGAFVAVGDTNGDGYADIITGASIGNPHVKVFDGRAVANGTFNPLNPDASLLDQFFAYDLQFNVGVTVGAADFDGDGRAEILTGASRGSPHFRVVRGDATGVRPPATFEGIPSDMQGGVFVGG